MHHQPSRLVDHQQVVIFEHHGHGHRFRLECLALLRGSNFNHQGITRLDLVCRLERCHAIEANQTETQQLLQVTAGKLRHHFGQRFIQTHTMLGDSNNQAANLDLGGL